ncbi:hypothetical protein BHE74_00031380, partial [Ensete ventricosum]
PSYHSLSQRPLPSHAFQPLSLLFLLPSLRILVFSSMVPTLFGTVSAPSAHLGNILLPLPCHRHLSPLHTPPNQTPPPYCSCQHPHLQPATHVVVPSSTTAPCCQSLPPSVLLSSPASSSLTTAISYTSTRDDVATLLCHRCRPLVLLLPPSYVDYSPRSRAL